MAIGPTNPYQYYPPPPAMGRPGAPVGIGSNPRVGGGYTPGQGYNVNFSTGIGGPKFQRPQMGVGQYSITNPSLFHPFSPSQSYPVDKPLDPNAQSFTQGQAGPPMYNPDGSVMVESIPGYQGGSGGYGGAFSDGTTMRGLGPRSNPMSQVDQQNPNLALMFGQGRSDAIMNQPFRRGYPIITQTSDDNSTPPDVRYVPPISYYPSQVRDRGLFRNLPPIDSGQSQ